VSTGTLTLIPFLPFRDQRDIHVPITKSLFKSTGITVSHFFSMLPSTLKYLCVQCCYAALHTVSFVNGCFAGKCILTGSTKSE